MSEEENQMFDDLVGEKLRNPESKTEKENIN